MKRIIFFILFIISHSVLALTVNNVKIERLYSQSLTGVSSSEAHALKVNKDIDASCNSRLYVEPEDKQLYSALLAYKLSDSEFNLMYSIGLTSKRISGHLLSSCKLFSIY